MTQKALSALKNLTTVGKKIVSPVSTGTIIRSTSATITMQIQELIKLFKKYKSLSIQANKTTDHSKFSRFQGSANRSWFTHIPNLMKSIETKIHAELQNIKNIMLDLETQILKIKQGAPIHHEALKTEVAALELKLLDYKNFNNILNTNLKDLKTLSQGMNRSGHEEVLVATLIGSTIVGLLCVEGKEICTNDEKKIIQKKYLMKDLSEASKINIKPTLENNTTNEIIPKHNNINTDDNVTNTSTNQETIYTVKKHDSLEQIVRKFTNNKLEQNDLIKIVIAFAVANNIKNPDDIRPDQELELNILLNKEVLKSLTKKDVCQEMFNFSKADNGIYSDPDIICGINKKLK